MTTPTSAPKPARRGWGYRKKKVYMRNRNGPDMKSGLYTSSTRFVGGVTRRKTRKRRKDNNENSYTR